MTTVATTVPHSPEAEMALLGAMILDPQVIGDVIECLPGGDAAFYQTAHAAIYRALVRNYEASGGTDLVQLLDGLRALDVLGDVGGVSYLEKLARETPGSAGAENWARIVTERYRQRQVIEAAERSIHLARTAGDDGQAALEEIESVVFEVCGRTEVASDVTLGAAMEETFKTIQARERNGIATGIRPIDNLLGGLMPGEMTIIAARPSQGKTALMLQVAMGLARGMAGGVHPCVFSLEMSRDALASRILCHLSGIDSNKVRLGTINEAELMRMDNEMALARPWLDTMHIDDRPGLTPQALRSACRRMVSRYQARVFLIDYLQLMRGGTKFESRQAEVAEISRSIKAMAKELNVPMVVLAQLNRGPTTRQDNRPRMSDLRESGAIEQDADVIWLLHREDQYHIGEREWLDNPANAGKIGTAEIIVAKNRNGPVGSVELGWDAGTMRFRAIGRGERASDGASDDGYSVVPAPQANDDSDHWWEREP